MSWGADYHGDAAYTKHMIVFLIILETLVAVSAQLLLRHGAMNLGAGLSVALVLEPFRNLSIFSGMVLHGVGFFLYIYILSKLPLNVFYPIATGATIVLIAVLSTLMLKETLTAMQIVGIAIIVLGIFLVFLTH